jgi:hypothetical protein
MAEISKFFNSAPGDPRTYQASDFADYFGSVLSTGLLHTDNIPALEVKCEGTDLRTYVTPGKAIIQGYLYENTSNLYLEHALPEPTLDRIDRIVLRLDKRNQSRYIKLFVKQGTPSENPVPPELQRDDFIYELSLAQIRVRANTSTLNPADLIDERLDENLCGLVHSLISIPTSQFQAEWDAFMASVQDEGFTPRTDFDAHLADTATNAHLAKNIGIEDPNNHFTATDVEGALEELFTSVRDGKIQVRDAITNKGGIVADGDGDGVPTFQELVNGVNSISQGNPLVQGTQIWSYYNTNWNHMGKPASGREGFFGVTATNSPDSVYAFRLYQVTNGSVSQKIYKSDVGAATTAREVYWVHDYDANTYHCWTFEGGDTYARVRKYALDKTTNTFTLLSTVNLDYAAVHTSGYIFRGMELGLSDDFSEVYLPFNSQIHKFSMIDGSYIGTIDPTFNHSDPNGVYVVSGNRALLINRTTCRYQVISLIDGSVLFDGSLYAPIQNVTLNLTRIFPGNNDNETYSIWVSGYYTYLYKHAQKIL